MQEHKLSDVMSSRMQPAPLTSGSPEPVKTPKHPTVWISARRAAMTEENPPIRALILCHTVRGSPQTDGRTRTARRPTWSGPEPDPDPALISERCGQLPLIKP